MKPGAFTIWGNWIRPVQGPHRGGGGGVAVAVGVLPRGLVAGAVVGSGSVVLHWTRGVAAHTLHLEKQINHPVAAHQFFFLTLLKAQGLKAGGFRAMGQTGLD